MSLLTIPKDLVGIVLGLLDYDDILDLTVTCSLFNKTVQELLGLEWYQNATCNHVTKLSLRRLDIQEAVFRAIQTNNPRLIQYFLPHMGPGLQVDSVIEAVRQDRHIIKTILYESILAKRNLL